MSLSEEALMFRCGDAQLLGILSRPDAAAVLGDVALLVVVGGPQYRVGSHRQFVRLARAAASSGFATLRFDFRGMGDSEGAQRNFEDTTEDIAAALVALRQAVPQAKRVALWGLCDGASAALLFLHKYADTDVAGLALLNPWVRSEVSLAKAQVKHYYRQRLMDMAFWKKLLSGKIAISALVGLLSNVRRAFGKPISAELAKEPYQSRMAEAWKTFRGQILLVLSAPDLTAREFLEYTSASEQWASAFSASVGERLVLRHADHTFSQEPDKRTIEEATCRWLAAL